jgi:hypothetical protein
MDKLPLICYLYDEQTGIYINRTAEAKEDLKVRGVFNIPVNATLDVPPSVADPHTQVAVFRNDKWVVERKGSVPLTDTPVATKQATKRVQTNEEEINQRR